MSIDIFNTDPQPIGDYSSEGYYSSSREYSSSFSSDDNSSDYDSDDYGNVNRKPGNDRNEKRRRRNRRKKSDDYSSSDWSSDQDEIKNDSDYDINDNSSAGRRRRKRRDSKKNGKSRNKRNRNNSDDYSSSGNDDDDKDYNSSSDYSDQNSDDNYNKRNRNRKKEGKKIKEKRKKQSSSSSSSSSSSYRSKKKNSGGSIERKKNAGGNGENEKLMKLLFSDGKPVIKTVSLADIPNFDITLEFGPNNLNALNKDFEQYKIDCKNRVKNTSASSVRSDISDLDWTTNSSSESVINQHNAKIQKSRSTTLTFSGSLFKELTDRTDYNNQVEKLIDTWITSRKKIGVTSIVAIEVLSYTNHFPFPVGIVMKGLQPINEHDTTAKRTMIYNRLFDVSTTKNNNLKVLTNDETNRILSSFHPSHTQEYSISSGSNDYRSSLPSNRVTDLLNNMTSVSMMILISLNQKDLAKDINLDNKNFAEIEKDSTFYWTIVRFSEKDGEDDEKKKKTRLVKTNDPGLIKLAERLHNNMVNAKVVERDDGKLWFTQINKKDTHLFYKKLLKLMDDFPVINGMEFDLLPLTPSGNFNSPSEWCHSMPHPLGFRTASSSTKNLRTSGHPITSSEKFSLRTKLRIYHI